MRILLLWPNFDADNAAGVRARAFAREWTRAGESVHVVTHLRPGRAEHEVWEGTEVRRLRLFHGPEDASRFWSSTRALRRTVRALAPDVAVVSSPSVLFAWQAVRVVRKLKLPWILDVRDFSTENLRANHGRKLKYVLLARMETSCFRRAPRLMHVTRLMGDELASRYGVPKDRLHYVPNGHDFPPIPPSGERLADVLYIGTINDESRRPREVLEAYARVSHSRPGTTFAFIGWREESPLAPAFRKRAAALGLTDALRLVPPVHHDEIPRWLAGSRIGVVPASGHPSYRAAVGAKTYEYLAGGLPLAVLGAQTPGSELERLVREHEVGLFAADMEGLAENLQRLLADERLWRRLSVNARRAAALYERGPIARRALAEVVRPLKPSAAAPS